MEWVRSPSEDVTEVFHDDAMIGFVYKVEGFDCLKTWMHPIHGKHPPDRTVRSMSEGVDWIRQCYSCFLKGEPYPVPEAPIPKRKWGAFFADLLYGAGQISLAILFYGILLGLLLILFVGHLTG